MTTDRPRRPPARSPDYTRILTRVEKGQGDLNDRIDGLFDQLARRFDRLEEDAGRADSFRKRLSDEMRDSKDELEKLKNIVTEHLEAHDRVSEARHDSDDHAAERHVSRRRKITPIAMVVGVGSFAAWLATYGSGIIKVIALFWRATLNSAEG